jgi:hypothetical protein
LATTITTDAGPIRIVLGSGAAARLFGVPFLVLGGWLGYELTLGLVDFAKGRSGSEMIPGTVLLMLFTLAFLVPGWLLLVSRATVEIDRSQGTVTTVRDLRLYRHRIVRKLSEFSSIEVDVLTTSPNQPRRRSGYQVELAGATRRNQVVGLFRGADEALEFGKQLSTMIGLPVADYRDTDRPQDE